MASTGWLVFDIALAAVFLAVTVGILAVGIRMQSGPLRRPRAATADDLAAARLRRVALDPERSRRAA